MMKQVLVLLFLLPFSLFSQKVTGSVTDQQTKATIPFPVVKIPGDTAVRGNADGQFSLTVKALPAQLIVSASEYVTDTITVNAAGAIIVSLQLNVTELGTVVIAASRRQQDIAEVPVSLEILKPELISNKGIVDLEQGVDQVPGVYAMDGQVSIRGGGGFSYGAGSRVLVLWNEVPLLSGDAGDAKWNSIPIEQVSQIEVIKGASSVLYGSGALNGIISLIEREPGSEGYESFKVQTGIYGNPERETLKWWNKNPLFHQADVAFGKQLNRQFSLSLGGYGYTTDGYRHGEIEDRGRINGTLYYKPQKISRLKLSLGWNMQVSKIGSFIIWQSDTFAYQPSGGADTSLAASTLTYIRGMRLTIDPSVKYTDKRSNRHQLKTRYYLVDNRNYTNISQSSQARVSYGDYQFQRAWRDNQWVLTAGATAIGNHVDSYLYGDHQSFNGATYIQGEWHYKRLDVTVGGRAEYFRQDTLGPDSEFFFGKDSTKLPVRPIFRSGIHYKLFEHTHLRASYGQGVRYPSIAERYTSTSVGGLNIFPNPAIRPETGWAAEFGVRQGVKIGNWRGFADAAAFINHYDNMMEFTFGNYLPDSVTPSFNPNDPGYIFNWLGFRAENAESATISGLDLSLSGAGKIGAVDVLTLMGYTYMNPVSNNKDSLYITTFSDSSSTMLKYRFRHMFKGDIQATWKNVSIGVSVRANSYMTNVDAIFEDGVLGNQILPGLKQYRAEHNEPNVVWDFRTGYKFKNGIYTGFIINNILNAEYMSRPGDIQPPRTFIVQVRYELKLKEKED